MADAPDLYAIVRKIGAGRVARGGREAWVPGYGHPKRDEGVHLTISGQRLVYHQFNSRLSHADMLKYLGVDPGQCSVQTAAEAKQRRRELEDAERKQDAADRVLCDLIWRGSQPIAGSPVETYLYSRGLALDHCEAIRFHPAAPRSKTPTDAGSAPPHPAMLAMVRSAEGAAKALHLTFIKPDGSDKAFGPKSRLMFGRTTGHAVQLEPLGPERHLAVGEGIETSASFSALYGVPCWAALSSWGLKSFELPRGLKKLIIAADGDVTGKEAALALAERARRYCDVVVSNPPERQDFNDILKGRA